MIKFLVKLALVALITNAAVRIGAEYLTYVEFRDDIRDAATFKANTDEELLARIVTLAAKYDIPLDEENVTIERVDQSVNVQSWYDKPIEILPTRTYPWHFTLSIGVLARARLPLLPSR